MDGERGGGMNKVTIYDLRFFPLQKRPFVGAQMWVLKADGWGSKHGCTAYMLCDMAGVLVFLSHSFLICKMEILTSRIAGGINENI